MSTDPNPCTCGTPDCPFDGGGYYVLATRGKQKVPVAGPFETHAEAMDVLPRAWLMFWKWNAKNTFKWETVKMQDPPFPPAGMNELLGVSANPPRMEKGE